MATADKIVTYLGLVSLALVGVLAYSLHVKADAGTIAVAAGALGTCVGALGSALIPPRHSENTPPQDPPATGGAS